MYETNKIKRHSVIRKCVKCQEVALRESCSIGVGILTGLNLYYIFVFRVTKQDYNSDIL